MTSHITRRDFINGVAVGIGGVAASGFASRLCANPGGKQPDVPYPPRLDGLRGSHVGSFEVAHSLRDGTRFDVQAAPVTETYDLIVAGAGISGLAAAYFYRQHKPAARVLILDTNDDFGGHAKRNEFTVDGQTLIGYGGTQSIDSPRSWSQVSKQLLRDLGVDVSKFNSAFDQSFYDRRKLSHATFFKAEKFGVDRLVRRPLATWNRWSEPDDPAQLKEFIAQFPLSEASRAKLIEMCLSNRDVLAGRSRAERLQTLSHTSYRDFAIQYWHADEEILAYLQTRTHDLWAVGIDAVPASETLDFPGLRAQRTALGEQPEEPYIYHFPDGNASIARLLVRQLIPGSAPGRTMEDIVTARFDYGSLDREASAVRLRLGSTVVQASNRDGGVDVAYVKNGGLTRVHARACVLACYHAMIPYLVPELDGAQAAALHLNVRAPLLYVNVAIRQWLALQRLGVAYIDNPGGTFAAYLDFPVSLGNYHFSPDPAQPVCIHLLHTPAEPNRGLDMRAQYRAGRAKLYTMTFADMEKEIRDEMTRMLGSAGFDFARDVAAITANRWPHGYAYTPTPLYDDPVEQSRTAALARRKIGRIAIANSDSGWDAYSQVAIDQAHRAVNELKG